MVALVSLPHVVVTQHVNTLRKKNLSQLLIQRLFVQNVAKEHWLKEFQNVVEAKDKSSTLVVDTQNVMPHTQHYQKIILMRVNNLISFFNFMV